MNILCAIRNVPDLVEELEIDESGTALDLTWLRLIINEFDNHALEQAVLLKEQTGGFLTVVAPDAEDVDGMLFTAAAKGADQVIKITGDLEAGVNNHALARALAALAEELGPDLVLTGVGAHNDLDGALGPLLAGHLGMPYVGYVAGVTAGDGAAAVRKEYPGGLVAELDVTLPAVLGIQAADQPPRYVAVSKIRQVMKTAELEARPLGAPDPSGGPTVSRMFLPETGARATMIEGDEEEIAAGLVGVFRELGVL